MGRRGKKNKHAVIGNLGQGKERGEGWRKKGGDE